MNSAIHYGKEEGMKKGLQEGLQKGLQEGKTSEKKDIAKKMLEIGMDVEQIMKITDLSKEEIVIYIIIAVILCALVLELSLDSYLVPVLLLANIGIAILINMGTNIFFGEISYITKALVAVLQLGVTTDFSIFLYNS